MALEIDGSDRLYVQLKPDGPTTEYLAGILRDLKNRGVAGRYAKVEGLHLTILHIGIVDNVYAQLRSVNLGLPVDLFLSELGSFYAKAMAIAPWRMCLQVNGLELFGDKGGVAAVGYRRDEELDEAFGQVMVLVGSFLRSCGVMSESDVPRLAAGLQIQQALRPHVTLVKGVKGSFPEDVAMSAQHRFILDHKKC